MSDIDILIARLEAATEGDRYLDADIAETVLQGTIEWKQTRFTGDLLPIRRFSSAASLSGKASEPVEQYTTSLDAALSLVPAGRRWQLRAWRKDGSPDLVYSCEVFTEAGGEVGPSGCAWAAATPGARPVHRGIEGARVIAAGDIVRLDFPGHQAHGSRVTVIRIDPAFNLAPEGEEPILAEVVFVKHPLWPDPIGVGRDIIGGTIENAARLRDERGDDETQGSLLL